MEKIASFTVNHLVLEPGIYVSRKDHFRDTVITTFDLRLTTPNKEPVLNTAEAHTIEHLGATFLRNEPAWKDRVVYFGPMGCRTGFYLLLEGDLESEDIVGLIKDLSLSATLRARSPEPERKNAETILIRIFPSPNTMRGDIWRILSKRSTKSICITSRRA